MKSNPPNAGQVAARKRNWRLKQLKSSITILKGFLPDYDFSEIENGSKRAIDRCWKECSK